MNIATNLRNILEQAVETSTADGILLSGGLDTSVLSAIAAKKRRKLRAVTVSVAGVESLDERFATMVAEQYGLSLRIVRPSLDDLIAAMPTLMRVLKGFDPMELRNS